MKNFNEEMGHIGTPQFPGQQVGKASIEAVRTMIKKQKRLKGYTFNAPVGTQSFNLDISGSARIFLGLAFFGKPTLPGTPTWTNFYGISQVELKINEEIIINQVSPNFLTPAFNNDEYYYIPRPLNGSDSVTLSFLNSGTVTEEINVVIYYI